jgi:hypothetical protein
MKSFWFVLVLLVPALCWAQPDINEHPAVPPAVAAAAPLENATNPFSLEGKVTLPTSYVYRGYMIQSQGFQPQPEANLGYTLPGGTDSLAFKPYVGVWGDFSTAAVGSKNPTWLSELDYIGGVQVTLPGGFSGNFSYQYYSYPSGRFKATSELGVSLGHTDYWNPHVGFYQSVQGSVGTYFEVGVDPVWTVAATQDHLKVDFPVIVGLGQHGTYSNSDKSNAVLGYASGGVTGTYTLSEHWSVFVGVTLDYGLADSVRATTGGSNVQFVGFGGVGFSF